MNLSLLFSLNDTSLVGSMSVWRSNVTGPSRSKLESEDDIVSRSSAVLGVGSLGLRTAKRLSAKTPLSVKWFLGTAMTPECKSPALTSCYFRHDLTLFRPCLAVTTTSGSFSSSRSTSSSSQADTTGTDSALSGKCC